MASISSLFTPAVEAWIHLFSGLGTFHLSGRLSSRARVRVASGHSAHFLMAAFKNRSLLSTDFQSVSSLKKDPLRKQLISDDSAIS